MMYWRKKDIKAMERFVAFSEKWLPRAAVFVLCFMVFVAVKRLWFS